VEWKWEIQGSGNRGQGTGIRVREKRFDNEVKIRLDVQIAMPYANRKSHHSGMEKEIQGLGNKSQGSGYKGFKTWKK